MKPFLSFAIMILSISKSSHITLKKLFFCIEIENFTTKVILVKKTSPSIRQQQSLARSQNNQQLAQSWPSFWPFFLAGNQGSLLLQYGKALMGIEKATSNQRVVPASYECQTILHIMRCIWFQISLAFLQKPGCVFLKRACKKKKTFEI